VFTIWQIIIVSFIEGTLGLVFGLAESSALPHVVMKELQLARERASTSGVAITLYHGDIQQLRFDASYDFIFLPTGTFSHLLTRIDVERFLMGVRRALRPKGIVALDVHNPTATWLKALPLPSTPKQTSFEHRRTHERITVMTTDEYQADRQILTQRHRYIFADGGMRESTVVLKLYFPIGLQWLLHYNGFRIEQIYGGYGHESLSAQSVRQIILARPTTEGTSEPASGAEHSHSAWSLLPSNTACSGGRLAPLRDSQKISWPAATVVRSR
jgi:SAM-dependent methyltransferase